MELTVVQKEILQELLQIYKEKNKAVKGTEIAVRLSRNPGTIRNQMQALRALNLVDGVPGPKGGYIPTSQTYRSLGLEIKEEIVVPIYKGEERIEGVNVTKIVFDTVTHERSCSSKIYIAGDTRKFSENDIVKIGPTHHNKIVILGKVVGRDDINHILLIDVIGVASVPYISVSEVGTKDELISIRPDETVKNTAKVLSEKNISGIPIMEDKKLLGIISLHDIADAVSKGLENEKVSKIMATNTFTISKDKKIYDALILMEKNNVGRLIIVNEYEDTVGIITRTDILKLIEGTIFPKILKGYLK
ncbi:putative signal transduction protein with CBS domains [Methanococcus vannielii SB]|uniref:Signal transduction protein with CBS domains n=1 Tax=Methanococcus vannielii (strain ATCC 35089 / DSM 1224 / JCM 13029 / OCM 148 / SB) TaxID=406327 RepID=A6UR45_METVS|nr:CBS domain-containing protein [Methanococcus vannielii]ABR54967.1 putative signal transduction protein with CBS domains [Methanococcus vannielii SB]